MDIIIPVFAVAMCLMHVTSQQNNCSLTIHHLDPQQSLHCSEKRCTKDVLNGLSNPNNPHQSPEKPSYLSATGFLMKYGSQFYPALKITWSPPLTDLSNLQGFLLRLRTDNHMYCRVFHLPDTSLRSYDKKLVFDHVISPVKPLSDYRVMLWSLPGLGENLDMSQTMNVTTPASMYDSNDDTQSSSKWSASIQYRIDTTGCIDVSFQFSNFQFDKYDISLVNEDSDEIYIREVVEKSKSENPHYGQVTFKHVDEGTYHIQVQPQDDHIWENQQCLCFTITSQKRKCGSCLVTTTSMFNVTSSTNNRSASDEPVHMNCTNKTMQSVPTQPQPNPARPHLNRAQPHSNPVQSQPNPTRSIIPTPPQQNSTQLIIPTRPQPNQTQPLIPNQPQPNQIQPQPNPTHPQLNPTLPIIPTRDSHTRIDSSLSEHIYGPTLGASTKPLEIHSVAKIIIALLGVILGLGMICSVVLVAWNKRSIFVSEQTSIKKKNILLLHADDHPHHIDAVKQLVSYLEDKCGCDVIYPPWRVPEISQLNWKNWILKCLDHVDYVVVVNSEASYKIYEAFTRHETYKYKNLSATGHLFLPFLQQIMKEARQTEILDKYISVSFDYTPTEYYLTDLPTQHQFKLMGQMAELVQYIHGIAQHHAGVSEPDVLEALHCAISKATRFEKCDVLWFVERFGESHHRYFYRYDSGFSSVSPHRYRDISICSLGSQNIDDDGFYPPGNVDTDSEIDVPLTPNLPSMPPTTSVLVENSNMEVVKMDELGFYPPDMVSELSMDYNIPPDHLIDNHSLSVSTRLRQINENYEKTLLELRADDTNEFH